MNGDLAVTDAHHHFWDPSTAEYAWMAHPAVAPLRRRYGPEHLKPLLSRNNVSRTVLVQTISSLDETREFLATAATTDFIAGVVGWIDLQAADVGSILNELLSSPSGRLLVGIRHQAEDEPDLQWLIRPDVIRGIEAVGRAGLVYDLLVKPPQLPAAVELTGRLPDVQFVVDHLAKPPIRDRDLEAWTAGMARIAARPNVVAKLSGLVNEADWSSWKVDDLRRPVELALDWFGPDRLLFGSDWPVCTLAATYGEVMQSTRNLLSGLSDPERGAIFGENAGRIYRLPAEV